jgi:IclR family transcriptional regulator, pca regulon regulatory protein
MAKATTKTRKAAVASNRGLAAFEGNPDFVLSLARGLKVLEAFEGQRSGMTAPDIAARTGLSRAAVRRLLMTLEMLGYAQHHGSVFRLKPSILRLGFSFLSSDSLPALAQPVLESVTEKIHESCSLSVLDNDQIVYLARSAGSRVMSVNLSVGTRLPAYCTSMGRVLLAGLREAEFAAYLKRAPLKRLTPKTITRQTSLAKLIERVRQNGYALVDEELEMGLRSIAVPVKNSSNRVVAAMNTGVHASRVSVEQMLECFLPILREHSTLLTHLAG